MIRFMVYGRSSCPYCVKAVSLLEEREEVYYFFDEPDRSELDYTKTFYNSRTVPIIISNDTVTGETRLIGGYSDLEREYE